MHTRRSAPRSRLLIALMAVVSYPHVSARVRMCGDSYAHTLRSRAAFGGNPTVLFLPAAPWPLRHSWASSCRSSPARRGGGTVSEGAEGADSGGSRASLTPSSLSPAQRSTLAAEVMEIADKARVFPATSKCSATVATFAGGCFWGAELRFQRELGVLDTIVGEQMPYRGIETLFWVGGRQLHAHRHPSSLKQGLCKTFCADPR